MKKTAKLALMAAGVMFLCGATIVRAERENIPKGYRAVTLDITAAEARSVKPGDEIDLLVQMENKNSHELSIMTMFQRVKVLDVVQTTASDITKYHIFVLFTAAEAQQALLANRNYDFSVVIRGTDDTELVPTTMTSLNSLFAGESKKNKTE